MRIFSFIKHSGLNFSEGVSGYQVSVTVSLRSKIFENFFVYRMLWTSNFLHGVFGHQLCLVTQNLRTQIFQNFFIYRVLWTELFTGGQRVPTLFGHTKLGVKNFS